MKASRPTTESLRRSRLAWLDSLDEREFAKWFADSLRDPDHGGALGEDPYEEILWVHHHAMSRELVTRLESNASRLLEAHLRDEGEPIDAAEIFHLGIVISRLQLNSLAPRLRRLTEQPRITTLRYPAPDGRTHVCEQLLYHLASLRYVDDAFWERHIKNPQFSGPAISR